MPNYKAHLVGGAVSFTIVYKLTSYCAPTWQINPLALLGGFGLALLGSIFPDIDISSRMQTLFFRSMLILLATSLVFGYWRLFMGGCGVSSLIFFLRHRTITHRPWFLISFPLVMLFIILQKNIINQYLGWFWYSCFVVGALSHIVLDFGIKKLFRRGI